MCGASKFGGAHAPNCDKQESLWTAWTDELAAEQNGSGKTASNSLPTVSGKYYLTQAVAFETAVDTTNSYKFAQNTQLYLDLNGQSVTAKSGTRLFGVTENGVDFVITDSSVDGNGYIKGNGTGSGGTIRMEGTTTSTVTLFRGAIIGTKGASYGGSLYILNGGIFVMNGGAMVGGETASSGGNITLENKGYFILNGGTISGGKTTGNSGKGGNVSIYGSNSAKASTFTINGGSVGGEVTVNGTTYSGGEAVYGGNIRVTSNGTLTINAGTVTGGTAVDKGSNVGRGGNLFMEGTGTVNLAGGTVDGDVYFSGSSVLNVSGKPVVNAEDKTNILVKTGKVITVGALEDGAVIGVTLEDETAVFTGVVDEAVAQYFVSDNQNKTVAHTANGLALAAVAP